MANHLKNLINIETTGLGNASAQTGRRLYRKDGKFNIIKKGLGIFERMNWFHAMIGMPRWKFWVWFCGSFVGLNLIFACIYYYLGIENLGGVEMGSKMENFAEAFFFSAQTFTTVGYGRISPVGLEANAIAAFEAFLGFLGFALAGGLFYGRFFKPKSYLRFSDNALISPFKGKTALMLRTAPYKNNHLMDAEVKLTMGMREEIDGKEQNVFYNLPVEFDRINALVLEWTIVHPINEESPFFGLTLDELKKAHAEILVFIKAYDEDFSNSIVDRTSYTANEIIEGARFKPMYHSSASGNTTILHIDKLNSFENVTLPMQIVSG